MKIKINDFSLNILESGKKNNYPTLVFLHYFGGSSKSWREVIGSLEDKFHCLAPDMRGFGESQDSAKSYTLEDYADDIEELAKILKPKSFVLVGHSMGGKIAQAVAARQPAKLKSLILIVPSPPTPEPMPEKERRRMLMTHGTRESAEETIKKGIVRDLPPEIFADAINANLQSSEAAWKAWLETGSREDISAQIGKINVPVFIIAGEKEENITAELLTREIVQRISNARLAILENSRHLLPLEAPAEIAALISTEIF